MFILYPLSNILEKIDVSLTHGDYIHAPLPQIAV